MTLYANSHPPATMQHMQYPSPSLGTVHNNGNLMHSSVTPTEDLAPMHPNSLHHSHMLNNGVVDSVANGDNIPERCRFCGQQLPLDAVTVVAHFNSHWRQFSSLENNNSACSYDQQHSVDNRIGGHPNFLLNHNCEMLSNQAHLPLNSSVLNADMTNSSPNYNYSYSPQNEPSNLSLSPNAIKCNSNDATDNTMRLNHLPCNTVHQQLPERNVQQDLSMKESSQSSLNCNMFGLSNMPNNNCNRASPLNLTGRPKVVSSPVVNQSDLTEAEAANGINSIEHNCILPSPPSLQHHQENIHSSNTNSHQSLIHLNSTGNSNQIHYNSNFSSNNYFNSQYSYNNSHSVHTELPSCRLQNFPNSLDNVGLTIPVLSPTLNNLQENECLEQQSRNSVDSNSISRLHGPSSLVLNGNMTSQCSVTNSPENDTSGLPPPHNQDMNYPNNCSPALNVSDNDSNVADNKSMDSFICMTCPKTFSSKMHYQSHLSEHIASKMKVPATNCHPIQFPQPCSVSCSVLPSCSVSNSCSTTLSSCSAVSGSPYKSLSHSLESQKPYKCSICNEEFSVKEDLHEHIQGHEAAKPFHCDVCGIGVSNQRALKRHKLTHTGHKPYKCPTCGKCFLQKHDLNRHMNIHERPKFFTCNQCKRTFTATSSYKAHKCKGTKEMRPFLCHICGDGCSNRLAWSYHMWKHTKNPKFVPFQENIVAV